MAKTPFRRSLFTNLQSQMAMQLSFALVAAMADMPHMKASRLPNG
jgi:hypothetical protein